MQRLNVGQVLQDFGAVARARFYLRRATLLGPRVRLWGRPLIHAYGNIVIGDRAKLVSTAATLELAAGAGATLDIGERCFINYGCSISASQLIRIGARSNIGTHAIIMDNGFHRLEPERRYEQPPSAPVVLEDNVWLGARVIVLPGVTIGTGSVIGAGSVVTKDIPPRSVAVGQPARVVRAL